MTVSVGMCENGNVLVTQDGKSQYGYQIGNEIMVNGKRIGTVNGGIVATDDKSSGKKNVFTVTPYKVNKKENLIQPPPQKSTAHGQPNIHPPKTAQDYLNEADSLMLSNQTKAKELYTKVIKDKSLNANIWHFKMAEEGIKKIDQFREKYPVVYK